jgi:hypothetical protein
MIAFDPRYLSKLPSSPIRVLLGIVFHQTFSGEYNGTIKLVWQSSVAASYHHRTNNKFAKDSELSTEGCVHCRIPKT